MSWTPWWRQQELQKFCTFIKLLRTFLYRPRLQQHAVLRLRNGPSEFRSTRLESKEYFFTHCYILRLEQVLLESVRYLSFSWVCSMQKIGRCSKSCGRGLDLSSSKDTTWKAGKLTSVTSWALESNIKFGCNLSKFFSTKKKSIASPKSRLSILIAVPCSKVYQH